ncbi:helix-turn-helix domain-containing protein [Denitrobaculum tricleocarpae]|uniref:Helix-turn-helix transcriptional regulator n=1 Tax=Denitrobaculum tricleocarpae TaxID=2591009 RepID=A0A545TPQ8_9PROT|nr:helix-turn-helix transcriptional regulator [Denitrobaculum tricleocarpae]TQV79210.1 helix-turn-helix transcriptional regulator [Denitrobaculum tricleocarpae]
MKSRRSSRAVDTFVGQRLRQQREENNMSAEELAGALSLPVKKLEQIECGEESIGALSLYEAAQVVGVPVTFFFEGYNEEIMAEETVKVARSEKSVTSTGDTIK